MQASTRQITLKKLAEIPTPANLHDSLNGTIFIDGVDSGNADYTSAALIGSPDTTNPAMGLVTCYKGEYRIFEADPLNTTGWPLGKSISAACGAGGGLVAFATHDPKYPDTPQILIHSSPAAPYPGWNLQYTVTFDQSFTGTIQAMLCRNALLYGFIKGKPPASNAFFFVDVASESAQVFPCDTGAAAAEAFFPVPSTVPANALALRRIAYCDDRIYTIDETHSSVLSVAFDAFGSPIPLNDTDINVIATVPLAKADTWGLVIHETLKKAYTQYTIGHGYVMPYTIDSQGKLTRGPDTIHASAGVCPTVDQNSGLLYLIGALGLSTVYDVATDTQVMVSKSGEPLPSMLSNLRGFPSSWMDSAHSILYVSAGKRASSNTDMDMLVYQVSG